MNMTDTHSDQHNRTRYKEATVKPFIMKLHDPRMIKNGLDNARFSIRSLFSIENLIFTRTWYDAIIQKLENILYCNSFAITICI